MAQPFDALAFREIFGRAMRNETTGGNLAYWVTPMGPDGEDKMPSHEFRTRVRAVQAQLQSIMDQGEIFYVNSEITQLLLEKAQEISDSRPLHWEPGDFPTRIGYVYFDGNVPLPTVLSRSGYQPLRALMWGQLLRSRDPNAVKANWLVPGSDSGDNADVIGKVVYSIVDNPDRWRNRTVERVMEEKLRAGRWVTRHWLPLEYDVRWSGEMAGRMMEESNAEYLTPEERREDDEGAREAIRITLKLLWIWCQFMQTEIVGHSRYDSSQHDKVVAREGRPPANIRVITLRRYAESLDPQHNHVEVDWQYRWKVREHYRNQRVGPGRAFIRRTLIREHWKGPENKPQAHQDTIQALVR